MDRHILIQNFWNVGFDGDKSVAEEDLGWSKTIQEDAQTDNPGNDFSVCCGNRWTQHLVLLVKGQKLVYHRNREIPN